MYAVERRQQIVDRARRDGRVAVTELSESLDVAPETIRRDLFVLEQQGLVNRVHGGALPADRIGFEGTVTTRRDRHPEEKLRIVRRAVAEVADAEVVFFDEGSTVTLLAEVLDPDRPLTAVTPSLSAAIALASRPQVSVILLGGQVRPLSLASAGTWPTRMLAEMVVDVAFLGANGITQEHGLTCPDIAVAAVKRAAVAASRRRVVLADGSKFGTDAFASFARLQEIDLIITGASAPRSALDALRGSKVQVVRA
ncbi:DeoR family transcriptional regulator [Nakamurella sp. YIM 132087]|uniref:Lactose phosphotransferase system repressor n=1 Tax=Nakamurella alba TaxID=2665158 RepID=A0A7K1FSQ7_9ACTN|nr:DeoR/GlpR family DNA-binding transcription regulator [Nakamurella alba]MTD16213.1 DeoR family transcriptional regulator [Nakamurella alba]